MLLFSSSGGACRPLQLNGAGKYSYPAQPHHSHQATIHSGLPVQQGLQEGERQHNALRSRSRATANRFRRCFDSHGPHIDQPARAAAARVGGRLERAARCLQRSERRNGSCRRERWVAEQWEGVQGSSGTTTPPKSTSGMPFDRPVDHCNVQPLPTPRHRAVDVRAARA